MAFATVEARGPALRRVGVGGALALLILTLGVDATVSEAQARARIRLGGSTRPSRETLALRPSTAIVVPVAATSLAPALSVSALPVPTPSVTGAVTRSVLDGARPASAGGTAPGGGAADKAPASAPEPARTAGATTVKAAEPWCRTGRLAGSGTGFCLIN